MEGLFDNLLFILQRFDWSSVIDIALVTIFFSLLLYMLRDTEALTLLRGVFLIVVLIFLLTSLVDLPAFSWLVSTVTPAMVFAIPILFAPEIRRALEQVGRFSNIDFLTRRTSAGSMEKTEQMLQEVTKAAVRLSERRHGALIVIRRHEFLTQYYKNGVILDSDVSAELLLQIFYPNTPLHDGAVIIEDNRIKAAACVMPLSASGVLNSLPERSMGLRHRAGLGISEVSDAIALVVSEETGSISIAYQGRLIRRLDGERLINSMRAFLFSDDTHTSQTSSPKKKGLLRRKHTEGKGELPE
ncbi:MAG: diadenylate cyclase CdaA [Anaerolineaceae bacterium]